jgi:signal transduction histidine kinase
MYLVDSNLLSRPLRFWSLLSIAQQFALASLLVISFGMLGLGYWISSQIRDGVIQQTATTTRLYMESFVQPFAQELDSRSTFNPQTIQALDNLLTGPLKGNLVAMKIWQLDGTIAYSNFPNMIGQKFEFDPALMGAMRGEVIVELGETHAEESVQERQISEHLLEVYSPLYHMKTGKLLGIGEFYLQADDLLKYLRRRILITWFLVAGLTACLVGTLSAIMFRASNTIIRQKQLLDEQIVDLSRILEDNTELSQTIKSASLNAAVLNDRMLNRIGADLHDGPAQLLAYALMRIPSFSGNSSKQKITNVSKVQQAIQDALREIREISSGLNLPQIENLALPDIIDLAIGNHERMTNAKVLLRLGPLPDNISFAAKTCFYRFIQEGLTNSFKHSGSTKQTVTVHCDGDSIDAEVSDNGNGFIVAEQKKKSDHLGLVGLQNRVQAFGGTLKIYSTPGHGCTLKIQIPVDGEGSKNEQ